MPSSASRWTSHSAKPASPRRTGRTSWPAGVAATLSILAAWPVAVTSHATESTRASIDYARAAFTTRRVLEWGTRPVWSADSKRIAFMEADTHDTQAYELDLTTRRIRCITCHLGMEGLVTRVFYLPDGSFLVLAPVGLGRGRAYDKTSVRSDYSTQELYWLANTPNATLQPLGAPAFGDLAVARRPERGGGVRIAWGEMGEDTGSLHTAILSNDGKNARLEQRKNLLQVGKGAGPAAGASLALAESYDIARDGRAVTFYTIRARDGSLDGEMYISDIATGDVRPLYTHPSHNESHLLPGETFALEESNRASDPSGTWRGVSSHGAALNAFLARRIGVAFPGPDALLDYAPFNGQRGLNRPFDLFVVSMDGSTPPRQLTDFSRFGVNAHQSAPSPDGRRVAYAIDPRGRPQGAALGGLYVGEFEAR
jgi:hypothetical protein